MKPLKTFFILKHLILRKDYFKSRKLLNSYPENISFYHASKIIFQAGNMISSGNEKSFWELKVGDKRILYGDE
jgi:hypothetical protein